MTASTMTPRFPRAAGVAVTTWLALALLAGATGFLAQLPFPGPQLIILALLAGTLAAVNTVPALRAWIDALPLRVLVGINATRFIGIVFLVLAARGELNPVFAARAGWGDIATAILAIVIVATWGALTPGRRLLYHAWNAFAFLDLVVAVGTATAVTLNGTTPGVAAVLTFPLSLVPTFLVLAARGEIAPVFAQRAGWGDIATAALALVLIAAGDPRTPTRRALTHAWNAFGALDLVVAVGTATWVTLHAVTPGVEPVLALPLVVIPTFFVPIFLASHVFIFRRLIALGRNADAR